MPLGKFMLGGAYFILKFYDGVCELFNKLPMHHIVTGRPGIIKIFIFYLVSFTLIFAVKYLKDYIYIKKDFDAGFSRVFLFCNKCLTSNKEKMCDRFRYQILIQ